MEVKITCSLRLSKDGAVSLRHELAPSTTPEEDIPRERVGMFGFPATISAQDALTVCRNLPTWIRERFKLEFQLALAETQGPREEKTKKA